MNAPDKNCCADAAWLMQSADLLHSELRGNSELKHNHAVFIAGFHAGRGEASPEKIAKTAARALEKARGPKRSRPLWNLVAALLLLGCELVQGGCDAGFHETLGREPARGGQFFDKLPDSGAFEFSDMCGKDAARPGWLDRAKCARSESIVIGRLPTCMDELAKADGLISCRREIARFSQLKDKPLQIIITDLAKLPLSQIHAEHHTTQLEAGQ